ncbi:hypothetical protein [Nocardia sp. NPDC020380]|uniref:RskA family anti-sigma factor n=1 Tax=Nocardia sp. NPDC020380 TaxID=3364309 RepID=UPI0037AFE3DD
MTNDESAEDDLGGRTLAELADAFVLDLLTEPERRAIASRRARLDPCRARAFDRRVAALYATLADLTSGDSCPPPAELEDRVRRAVDILSRLA